ncbi:putative DNA binding domain-containing protein [Eubacteriaceae bacterium ES3]|nr:putative DNA binding domain-containing protein [Eubacteriaceae bacterium ES3]
MDALILLGENKYIEYKAVYSKTLLKTVSAFANYHDGVIIIGIDDNKQIVGIEDPDRLRLNLENTINDAIEPRPYYEIEIETYEGLEILLIRVYKGDNTPYLYDKKAYKRLDTASVPVDRSALDELILYGKNMTFDMMRAPQQNLSFVVLNSHLKSRLNLHHVSDDLLITLELKVKDQYNMAAALLSDDNPLQQANLQLIAYDGNGVAAIKDRLTVMHQSLLKHFEDGMAFYYKHINQSEKITTAYRESIAEVPLVAYREALANLIVHRDYSRPVDGRIEIFDDRIEILSPGGLPLGINESEYLSGRISVPRNRIIADIFFRLHIIEKLATGIRRIKEYYQDYRVEPSFIIEENSITIVLPKVTQNSPSQPFETTYPIDLTPNERRILEILKTHKSMTRQQLETALDLKKTQTNTLIQRLKANRLLIQVGSGRSTVYQIAPGETTHN